MWERQKKWSFCRWQLFFKLTGVSAGDRHTFKLDVIDNFIYSSVFFHFSRKKSMKIIQIIQYIGVEDETQHLTMMFAVCIFLTFLSSNNHCVVINNSFKNVYVVFRVRERMKLLHDVVLLSLCLRFDGWCFSHQQWKKWNVNRWKCYRSEVFFFSFSGVERGGRMRERERVESGALFISHIQCWQEKWKTRRTHSFSTMNIANFEPTLFFHPLTFFWNRWNRMRWETQNKVSLKKFYATDFLCFSYLLISLHYLLSMFRKNLYQVFLLLSPFHPMPSVKKM